jgi:hypothetical protein
MGSHVAPQDEPPSAMAQDPGPGDRLREERRALLARLLQQQAQGTRLLPTSLAQEALWVVEQMWPGAALYNVPCCMRLRGALSVPALGEALAALTQRHEVLRTTFVAPQGRPLQLVGAVKRPGELPPVVDLSGLPEQERERQALRVAAQESRRPFDLTREAPLRASLLRLGTTEHVLVLVFHHIAVDGWSVRVLLRDLSALYARLRDQPAPQLPELPVQFGDCAHWQREWLQGRAAQEQSQYWRQRLAGAPMVLELPTDFERPAVRSAAGRRHRFSLPAQTAVAAGRLAKSERATLFMVLLAGFQAWLGRMVGQEDFVVGSPIANRHRPEVAELIGPFVNMLPLRADLGGGPTFREVVRRVRQTCLGAYAHQDLPFERLVEDLGVARDPGRNPLFQVAFALQEGAVARLELPGVQVVPLDIELGVARFDLTVLLEGDEQGLEGLVSYSTELFAPETMARWMEGFGLLLDAAVAEPDLPLPTVPVPGEADQQKGPPSMPDTTDQSVALPAGRPAVRSTPIPSVRQADLEKIIAGIWREVLHLDGEIRVTDNFFDVGGTSLTLVQVHRKLQRVLSGSLPLIMLFQFSTIESLARKLAEDVDERAAARRGEGRALQRQRRRRPRAVAGGDEQER